MFKRFVVVFLVAIFFSSLFNTSLSMAAVDSSSLQLDIADQSGSPVCGAVVDVYVRTTGGPIWLQQIITDEYGVARVNRPDLTKFDFWDDTADITLKVFYPGKEVESLYWSLPTSNAEALSGLLSAPRRSIQMKDSASGQSTVEGWGVESGQALRGSGVFRSKRLTTSEISRPVVVGEMHFISDKVRAEFSYETQSSTTIQIGKAVGGGSWSGNGSLTRTTTSNATLPSDNISGGSCQVKMEFAFDYEYWAYQEQDVDDTSVWHNIYTWVEFVPNRFLGFPTPGESVGGDMEPKDSVKNDIYNQLYGFHGELFPGAETTHELKNTKSFSAAYTYGSWTGSATANYSTKAKVKQTCIDNSGTHEYYAYDMDKKERVWYVTYGAK
ncbi:MAG TPA: hypothetical protein DDZ53_10065 [Firmicutes bacterium]|jgi:hypothetical protein|nr:hypothetical protein [Bacillota bacterium]